MIILEYCPKRILLDYLKSLRPRPDDNSETFHIGSLEMGKFCWQIAKVSSLLLNVM